MYWSFRCMKSTLMPLAPQLAYVSRIVVMSASNGFHKTHRTLPTFFCLPYAISSFTSMAGLQAVIWVVDLVQPSSRMTYSIEFSEAKSMKYLYVSVLMPDLKSTPKILLALYQSQATLPGLIQSVFSKTQGSANWYVR